jgi:hypothetical protein
MNVKSRFSSNEAVDFEFESDSEYTNTPTVYVSMVAVNFATQASTAGQVQLIYADAEGEDII